MHLIVVCYVEIVQPKVQRERETHVELSWRRIWCPHSQNIRIGFVFVWLDDGLFFVVVRSRLRHCPRSASLSLTMRIRLIIAQIMICMQIGTTFQATVQKDTYNVKTISNLQYQQNHSLNAMCENHHQSGLNHYILSHMGIVTAQNQHSLFARNPPAHVIIIDPSILLACFQRAQSPWPATLMAILHQIVENVRWTTGLR